MAARETKTLSAPAIWLDGRRLKIIPNTCTVEYPGEISSRAVSAGGTSHALVHGVNIEEFKCVVKFEVANTEEMGDLVEDYNARRNEVIESTLRISEGGESLAYDQCVMVNKIERAFEPEGSIPMEFCGRYLGV